MSSSSLIQPAHLLLPAIPAESDAYTRRSEAALRFNHRRDTASMLARREAQDRAVRAEIAAALRGY